MSKKIIHGDIIVFENAYSQQDIIIKHSSPNYRLIFNSEVIFKKSSKTTEVQLGKFDIVLSDDKESLLVKKNGTTLFTIKE